MRKTIIDVLMISCLLRGMSYKVNKGCVNMNIEVQVSTGSALEVIYHEASALIDR